MSRTRLLECWWRGRTAWLLDRTRARWRHRDLHARLRSEALDVGARLVEVRHGQDPAGARAGLDRLAWLAGVARDCGALAGDEADELGRCIDVTRALLG